MDDSEFPVDEDALDETFKRAADFVTYNASVMQQDDLLFLYGRYKQALHGKCNEPMPGILKFRNRSKWNSWNALGDLSKTEAMKQYVEKVSQISPDWDSAKPKDSGSKRQFGPVTSICLKTDPELKEESKTVFDFVKEGNLEQIKKMITIDPTVKDCTDDDGLSLLHWACDRGYNNIVSFLISIGINVDSLDKDGQAPLHYASSCGHEEVVKMLLKHRANINIFDSDGLSPADVAYSTTIKDILSADNV
ncbi:acyl-CoA-binding domain-containing protein 6-like [Uloborus diversus]|uniref:acyl-CoA-binding domain-containing protein 6-like n=1 Tax=Uloborus diversus TaxID=327109 RepID=UPI0024095227|nr:acyl-CoA-binding domain-containing protein 6-like [Uloborus diversus]